MISNATAQNKDLIKNNRKNHKSENFLLVSREDVGVLYSGLNNFFASLSDNEKIIFGELVFAQDKKSPVKEFLNIPIEQVLNRTEQLILEEVQSVPVCNSRAQFSAMVVVLKATRLCNLRCTYCHAWREGPGHVMPFAGLIRTIRDALCASGIRHIDFVWHGGEATLLGIKFLRKALWLQQRFAPDTVTFTNSIQTNAVNISDEMLHFLKVYKISVGVSIDGPPIIDDKRRVDKDGNGTSERILKTLQRLKNMKIPYGLFAVIDKEIASLPPKYLLDYFLETGAAGIDILNALPENTDDSCNVIGSYIPY